MDADKKKAHAEFKKELGDLIGGFAISKEISPHDFMVMLSDVYVACGLASTGHGDCENNVHHSLSVLGVMHLSITMAWRGMIEPVIDHD